MKKSIPVSDDLSQYFTDPCPVLSGNNTQFIFDEIRKGYDYVVEYGMGASTLYFLPATQSTKTKFISIENNINWFDICLLKIKEQTDFHEVSYSRKSWLLKDIRKFTTAPNQTDIPDKLRRFSRWSESLNLGPFFRFSPNANGRFSGKLGFAWPALKPAFECLAGFLYLISPSRRPQDAEWIGRKEGRKEGNELILRNIAPSIKDQYGEAPNLNDYIHAGLKDIKADLDSGKTVTTVFMVDGGPRHKIVQEILSMENHYKNFKPTIFLCDASRIFYHPTLAQRPSGKFMAGTGLTLKGGPVANDVSGDAATFWVGGDKTAHELAQQEVWFYQAGN